MLKTCGYIIIVLQHIYFIYIHKLVYTYRKYNDIISISLRYLFWTTHIENVTVYMFYFTTISSLYYSIENWIGFYSVAIVFHPVVEYYYSFDSQTYLLLCTYTIRICAYRWCNTSGMLIIHYHVSMMEK